MQALENPEDLLLILGVDADAVVTHGEYPMSGLLIDPNMHDGRPFRAAVFYGVANEVLEQLLQAKPERPAAFQGFRASQVRLQRSWDLRHSAGPGRLNVGQISIQESDQIRALKRLCQIVVHPRLDTTFAVARQGIGRHGDYHQLIT